MSSRWLNNRNEFLGRRKELGLLLSRHTPETEYQWLWKANRANPGDISITMCLDPLSSSGRYLTEIAGIELLGDALQYNRDDDWNFKSEYQSESNSRFESGVFESFMCCGAGVGQQ